MLKGEIALVRSLEDHAVWQGDLALRGAWVDLLLRANTTDAVVMQRGESVQIKRGQLAWSIKGLADKWHVCEEKAGKILGWLQQAGCIRVVTTRRRTLITITNYDLYQAKSALQPGSESETESETESGTQPGSESETEPDSKPETTSAQSREKRDRRHTPRTRGGCPDWSEVEAFAAQSGIDREFALDWFQRKVNNLTYGFDTLLDWRADLLPYWRQSGMGEKSGGGNGLAANGHARPESPVARRIALEKKVRSLAAELETHSLNCSAPPYSPEEQADFDRLRGELKQTKLELQTL